MVRLLGLAALIILAALAPPSVQAQLPDDDPALVRLAVGDHRVDGSHVEPFAVTWRATPYDDSGTARASNRVEETVELVGNREAPLLRFTQTWYDSLDAVVFTTVRVAERRTMEYRAFHTGGAPGGFGHLDLRGGRASGVYVEAPEGPTHYFALALEDTPFASFAGLLFTALPLEPGLVGEFPAFGWGGVTNPASRPQRYSVVADEEVSVPRSGDLRAHRVVTSRSTGSETIYWISRTAPYFLRAESHAPGGSRTIFEIQEWTPLPPGLND